MNDAKGNWLIWIFISSAGGLLGFLCMSVMNKIAVESGFNPEGMLSRFFVVFATLLVVSLVQWSVIRSVTAYAAWWPIVTSLVGVLSWLLMQFVDSPLSWVVPACAIYIAQYVLLHKQNKYPARWILSGIVMAVVGYFLGELLLLVLLFNQI
jgi:hypothetical protein